MRLLRLIAVPATLLALAAIAHAAGEPADFSWKTVAGASIPPGTFSAAPPDRDPLYICRVRNNRDVTLGTAGTAFCNVGGDGMNRPYSLYEILIKAPGARWAKFEGTALPAGSVSLNAGHGPNVYACRITYQGRLLIGMVRDTVCIVGYETSELQSDEFEVLVIGDTRSR